MYTIDSKNPVPTHLSFLFVHKERKNKKYLHVDLNTTSGKVEAVISASDDGMNKQFPVVGERAVDTLPALGDDLVSAALLVGKHFKKNGFKEANTITQTKNGLKFS